MRAVSERVEAKSTVVFVGLIAFFWFEYMRPGNYFPILDTIKLNTLIPIGAFVIAFFSKAGRAGNEILNTASTRWFLGFLALFALQFVLADVRLYVYNVFKAFIGYLLIYYVIVKHVTNLDRIKFVFVTLVLVHVMLVGLYPDVVLRPEQRSYLAGTFLSDGNEFAWSACIAIPLSLFLARSSRSRVMTGVHYAMFVLLVLAVIGTQSRGGSLALGVAMLYLAMKSRRKGLALTGLGALVAIVLLFAPSVYFDRVGALPDYETDGSAQGRILAWTTAGQMALDRPLTGVGPGHFSVMFGAKYKPANYVGPYLNAHSIYFLMLGEFGFPGIVFLIGLIICNFVLNGRIIRNARATEGFPELDKMDLMLTMQASLLGYAMAGAFLGGFYYPHLFVLAGLMESARFVVTRGQRADESVTARKKGLGV